MAAAIEDRGKMVFRRRGFLGAILAAGARRHGRRARLPPPALAGAARQEVPSYTTDWTQGSYLVDLDGNRFHKRRPRGGGFATVFPEGLAGPVGGARRC